MEEKWRCETCGGEFFYPEVERSEEDEEMMEYCCPICGSPHIESFRVMDT